MTDERVPVVIKYGGSSLDLELDLSGRRTEAIKRAEDGFRRLEGYPLVVMPGGGPTNELLKALRRNYSHVGGKGKCASTLMECAKDALMLNAKILACFWDADLIDAGALDKNNTLTSSQKLQSLQAQLRKPGIHVLPFTPQCVVEADPQKALLRPDKSDSLTLAVAEMLNTPRVTFLKNTDGIFNIDWKWGSPEFKVHRFFINVGSHFAQKDLRKRARVAGLDPDLLSSRPDFDNIWKSIKHIPDITADEILPEGEIPGPEADSVWRVGADDGEDDHLIETAAIRYFQGCRNVKAVVIGQVLEAVTVLSDVELKGMTDAPSHQRSKLVYSVLHKEGRPS